MNGNYTFLRQTAGYLRRLSNDDGKLNYFGDRYAQCRLHSAIIFRKLEQSLMATFYDQWLK